MNKMIMVTGADGFIGSAFLNFLKNKNERVISLGKEDANMLDYEQLERKIKNVNHIFHLANKTFVPLSWEEPELFINNNVMGTLNLLKLCRIHDISMTYVSAYIYGEPERLPIKETDKIKPNNPYALSKYMAEELCKFYAEQYGVKVTVVRPFNVYGIGQKDRFLIPSIIRQAIKCEAINVMDLSPKRDYIYLKDLLDLMYKTIDNTNNYIVVNAGTGVSYSVEEVIKTILSILEIDKPIHSKNEIRKNELNDVVADINNAKKIFLWEPVYSLEKGLTEIVNDILSKGKA